MLKFGVPPLMLRAYRHGNAITTLHTAGFHEAMLAERGEDGPTEGRGVLSGVVASDDFLDLLRRQTPSQASHRSFLSHTGYGLRPRCVRLARFATSPGGGGGNTDVFEWQATVPSNGIP